MWMRVVPGTAQRVLLMFFKSRKPSDAEGVWVSRCSPLKSLLGTWTGTLKASGYVFRSSSPLHQSPSRPALFHVSMQVFE